MDDIQIKIDKKISIQIKGIDIELSGEEAEKLYNLLGNALNKSPMPVPYVPYKQPEWEPKYMRWEPFITC
jgi:hypothetical protein